MLIDHLPSAAVTPNGRLAASLIGRSRLAGRSIELSPSVRVCACAGPAPGRRIA
jgi:hypothetical protein